MKFRLVCTVRFALLFCVLAAALPLAVSAQDERHGIREFVQSGSYTWRVPAGVTYIIVELWGAGSGGAAGASAFVGGEASPGGGGGGGGSGAFGRASLAVTDGETYTINVGAGGRGGRRESRDPAQAGGNGEDTAILRDGNVLLIAEGGRGGSVPKRGDIKGGAGGAGGRSQPTPIVLVRAGNDGDAGHTGGFADATSTPGGVGGAPVSGSVRPPGSFGGAGAPGRRVGETEDGQPGGAGSVLITW